MEMEIQLKRYIRYLFGTSFLVFVLNKLIIRSWLIENDAADIFLIITYSIPNLIEAIFGIIILTGILIYIRQKFNHTLGAVKNSSINILALCIASIYVITQELKFHNLGGNNVFDPYDLIASIIGLLATSCTIQLFGFTEKRNDS